MSSPGAHRERQQLGHAQGGQSNVDVGEAGLVPDNKAEQLAQGGLLPDALLQVSRHEQLFYTKVSITVMYTLLDRHNLLTAVLPI